MNIVVTGGTGFIGHALVEELSHAGHDVVVLSRRPHSPTQSKVRYVEWDARSVGPWQDAVAAADAVVNLAGEPIAEGRWTSARKRILFESRILATRSLVDAIATRSRPLPVLISASGIGYYGLQDDRVLDERSPLGEGFLAQLSAAWEAEALRAGQFGTRVVLLRTGMVLERDGGALPKMMLPFRLFAGGPVLPGTQWVSWIHRADLI
ncbi:MAG TPA: TIGR01777 family oxidoreductase, partial [Nitrospira sp.]|nr:TIGR01777 family oxidoreductase [Nitrospira sp.]